MNNNDNIKKHSLFLSHIHFSTRMHCFTDSSLRVFKKWILGGEKKEFFTHFFMLSSVLELSMRSREGILIPYNQSELNSIFGNAAQALFRSQNRILRRSDFVECFAVLFSLWQFEEQEDMFVKFYRYNFFFNFENDKIDMKKLLLDAFGTDYSDFLYLAVDVVLASTGNNFKEQINQIVEKHPIAMRCLSITSDDYYQKSLSLCEDIEDIAFSLKISNSFPFIKHKGETYLPLPYACVTACTKSLLYRLTYEKDDNRRIIGKEVIESYVFDILSKSNIYDLVSPEVFFVNTKKKKVLSPDVLCFKDERMIAFECKLLTPSSKTRLLDKESLEKTKEILVDDVCQLYKSLFVYYACEANGLPEIQKNDRYGTVVFLERLDFDHRTILERASQKLGLDEKEKVFLEKHVRFDALYDLETLTFANGNAIEEMRTMAEKNQSFDYSLARTTCKNEYVHPDFIRFKKDILDQEKIESEHK